MRSSKAWVLGVVLATAVLTTAAAPAHAAPDPCGATAPKPAPVISTLPWAQTWMDLDRLHNLATGKGQVIAVIDTGSDGTHPQLRLRVDRGVDDIRQAPDDNVDCNSHGTAVASLIVAAQQSGVGLRGLAPDAMVLPIRVSNTDPAGDATDPSRPSPGIVASGIRQAIAADATVIDISPSFSVNDADLGRAVNEALRAGIVVVAAAGDTHDPSGPAQDPPSYPAAYPGVIGVGAVTQTFARAESSVVGPQVKITAPGADVIAAARRSGHQRYDGSSIAAAFVAATAALVRQTSPQLTPGQVATQIIATADSSPDARADLGYTPGMLNPYRAVTEPVSEATMTPQDVAGVAAPRPDPAGEKQAAWWHRTTVVAVITALLMAAGLLLVGVFTAAASRGRLRNWVPGRRPIPDPAPSSGGEPPDDDDIFALPSIGAPGDNRTT